MKHTGIDRVTYGVTEHDKAERFWRDFGLQRRDSVTGQLMFSALNGSEIEIRAADDDDLPEPVGDEPDATVREVTFGVETEKDLEDISRILSRHGGMRTGHDGTLHTTDPLGFGVAFRVSRTLAVTAPDEEVNVPGRARRINKRGNSLDHASPMEISHVVYVTDDLEEQKAFYVDRLGFRVTDSYPGRGYFLRCGAARNHHNLFLLDPGEGNRGFHHVAFELGSIHELFGGGNNMTRQGWETRLGPGRHPISSCYFWYFKNPCGGAAEYDFDSDVVDDDWVPGEWESTPENFAEWCLAEGMGEALLYKGIQRG